MNIDYTNGNNQRTNGVNQFTTITAYNRHHVSFYVLIVLLNALNT